MLIGNHQYTESTLEEYVAIYLYLCTVDVIVKDVYSIDHSNSAHTQKKATDE